MIDDWFNNAQIAVLTRDNTVTSARFMRVVDSTVDRSEWRANCVRTTTDMREEFNNAPAGFVGTEVVDYS